MKKRYSIIFILLALSLLYFVLSKIGFRSISEGLGMLKWYYLVLAISMNLFVFIIWNYKWKLLVCKISKIKFWELFPILMTGNFFNTATPTANLGGEPLRAYYLGKRFRKEKSKYFATIIIDKLTNAVTSLVFVLFSVLFISLFLKVPTTVKILTQSLIIISLVLVGLALFYRKIKLKTILRIVYPFFKKKYPNRNTFDQIIEKKRESVKGVLKRFYSDKKSVAVEVLLGMLMQLLTFAKAYVLFIALGQEISPLYVILTVSISMMIGQIIIVPGGIGVVESSMISLYTLLGVNVEIAATVAVVDRIVYYVITLGGGYLSFSYVNYKYR